MNSQTRASRVRLGILTLPTGLILIMASALLYGERIDPTADPVAYAEWAGSASFAVSNFLFVIGTLLGIFGFFALYAHVASQYPAGTVLETHPQVDIGSHGQDSETNEDGPDI